MVTSPTVPTNLIPLRLSQMTPVTTIDGTELLWVSQNGVSKSATVAQVALVTGQVSANRVMAGPASGAAAAPSFRLMVVADLPSIADQTMLGNVAGSAHTPIALSKAQITTLVNPFTSTLSGGVPLSGGGTANFLRADGTWAPPVGTIAGLIAGTAISLSTSGGNTTITNIGVTQAVAGGGIGVSAATGNVTFSNTGVLSNIAGSGITVSGATGNVTITNSGVLSAVAGSGISVSGATGNVTFGNTGVLQLTAGANVSISGSTGNVTVSVSLAVVLKTRNVSGTVTVSATTDYFLGVDTSGGVATINLPAAPATGLSYIVKDVNGNAATNNITIVPAAGNIDGAGTFVMPRNYMSVTLVYNGTQWSIC